MNKKLVSNFEQALERCGWFKHEQLANTYYKPIGFVCFLVKYEEVEGKGFFNACSLYVNAWFDKKDPIKVDRFANMEGDTLSDYSIEADWLLEELYNTQWEKNPHHRGSIEYEIKCMEETLVCNITKLGICRQKRIGKRWLVKTERERLNTLYGL